MINARRAVLVIPILLAACSTGGSVTPTGPTNPTTTPSTGTATATPSASATEVATDQPSPAPTESAGSPAPSPDATVTPAATLSGDLESLLPTEIAGNAMTIEPASDPARSFMILWNDEQVAEDLLDALGGSPDDIDVVFSYPEGDTFPDRVSVDAYRVAGADGTALRDGFVQNYRTFLEPYTTISVTEETVGGKQVVLLEQPESPDPQGQYFYGVGDIVFVVSGTPTEWVEDALARLP
jgi:hypothetical protein